MMKRLREQGCSLADMQIYLLVHIAEMLENLHDTPMQVQDNRMAFTPFGELYVHDKDK